MKNKICVSTVVSADEYMGFIPLFRYTLKRAYPEVDLKVFVRGKCDYPDTIQNWGMEYPTKRSTCNTLRFLIDASYFKKYEYVYFTDIDFLIFKHKKSIFDYLIKELKESNVPYAAARGPFRMKRRKEINGGSFTGNFSRIAAGFVLIKNPEWFTKCATQLKKYNEIVKKGTHDEMDAFSACSYREFDEVMLYRIIIKSGLKASNEKNCFLSGRKFNASYRYIHLGDFKFMRWRKKGKMNRILKTNSVKAFCKLEKEPEWLKLVEKCSESKLVKKMIVNLRKHIHKRMKKTKCLDLLLEPEMQKNTSRVV